MQTFHEAPPLRARIQQWRQAGERIALVPTMGNLHNGHLTLTRKAREYADRVVVSVFVNPMQFDRPDDLAAYPRTLEQDQQKLVSEGVDCLFAPTVATMYPRGLADQSFVEVPGLSEQLEGASRPGHFRGVTTVVSKLFNLVQPDIACFGEKDYQQLAILRRMVLDLSMPIDIIGVPIVRNQQGLALSSRNGYLTEAELQQAPALYQALQDTAQRLQQGTRDTTVLSRQFDEQISAAGFTFDTLDFRDADNLEVMNKTTQRVVILAAAYLGKARLIDNLVVTL